VLTYEKFCGDLSGSSRLHGGDGQYDRGRISGVVIDSSGAVVRGATITATSDETGELREATSDDQGYYVVPNLPPNSYTISAKANQLAAAEMKGVTVSVGQERNVNLTLNPTGLTQIVTVSGGDLTQVDTSSARIGAADRTRRT
jgi:Carboxypeptidase regulatory-like domain